MNQFFLNILELEYNDINNNTVVLFVYCIVIVILFYDFLLLKSDYFVIFVSKSKLI